MKLASLSVVTLALVLSACGPKFVRGSEMKELDDYAMSTGLDKRDLEALFEQNFASFSESGIVGRWKQASAAGTVPTVAVFPVKNETSEHIDSQLDALLSKIETKLVNSGVVDVISRERQKELVNEVVLQGSAAFDQTKAAQLGRQVGAKYFVTGKVYDSAERSSEERRIQYFLFLQIIEVETGSIRWQNESSLTKGLVS
jgi:uncharacterized protein (TIGR02722 family)